MIAVNMANFEGKLQPLGEKQSHVWFTRFQHGCCWETFYIFLLVV